MRLLLLVMLVGCACGLKYVRSERPLLLPGDRCRLVAGTDEWQYPPREVRPSGLEGLPEEVERCFTAGLRADAPVDQLEQRLRDVGYLDVKLPVLGERYTFAPGAPEEVTELISGPYVEAAVLLAQEKLSRRAKCRVEVKRGAPDVEAHVVAVTFEPCAP
ncbi:MAG: hypothetical protein JNK82_26670 [Myxococcaceae bacterium]|nr:hypothetical protein [Myxococcaceae bacterium]